MTAQRIFTPLLFLVLCLMFHSPLGAEKMPAEIQLGNPGGDDTGENTAEMCGKNPPEPSLSRTQKTWALNLGAAGTVIAWGVINWDYFSRAPTTENEKWFGHDTKSGGADKLGHLWATYAMSRGFAAIYTRLGYTESIARLYGPLSALGVTGVMEIGDSFSAEHGFSSEDMAANVVGAGIGWCLLRYPKLSERIDLRWEYSPDFSNLEGDITTDYENSKYLLALKAEGFDSITNPYFKCLELHLGYYTRGYAEYNRSGTDKRKRYLYAGAGINVGRLISHIWDTSLFNYIQVPYTYAEVSTSLE